MASGHNFQLYTSGFEILENIYTSAFEVLALMTENLPVYTWLEDLFVTQHHQNAYLPAWHFRSPRYYTSKTHDAISHTKESGSNESINKKQSSHSLHIDNGQNSTETKDETHPTHTALCWHNLSSDPWRGSAVDRSQEDCSRKVEILSSTAQCDRKSINLDAMLQDLCCKLMLRPSRRSHFGDSSRVENLTPSLAALHAGWDRESINVSCVQCVQDSCCGTVVQLSCDQNPDSLSRKQNLHSCMISKRTNRLRLLCLQERHTCRDFHLARDTRNAPWKQISEERSNGNSWYFLKGKRETYQNIATALPVLT